MALIVEHDASLGRMLARLLERWSYRVRLARTVDEAGAVAGEMEGLDLLVLDHTAGCPRAGLLLAEVADRWPRAGMVVLTLPSASFLRVHRVSNLRFLPMPFTPSDLARAAQLPLALPTRRLLAIGG